MSRGGFSHIAIRKRSLRIGVFNIVAWILGVIIGFIGLIATSQLWPLLFIPLALLIGLPIPDVGSPHAWVIREWRAKSQYKRDKGVLLHAPFASKPNDAPCKFEQIELVMARLVGRKGKESFLPLFTDAGRNYVTMPLQVGGASKLWLTGDGQEKYNWDLDWLDAVARALSTTREPKLDFVQSRFHRPANKEPGLAYNRARGETRALAAAASNGHDPRFSDVEIGIGLNLVEGFENAYAIAGEPSNYCYVRMPWPTRFGRKISLDDADAFRKSNLFKTISKVLDAYRQMELKVDLVDLETIRVMWDEFWHLSDLDTVRMYRKRDEELPPATTTDQAEEPQLKKPISIRASKPGEDGWIDYGGSFHIAGYATKVSRDNLRPGFQEAVTVVSDDTYYSLTTYIQAPLVLSEVNKSREKERLLRSLQGWNPLTKGLSDPEEKMRFDEVLDRRVRLAEGSQRAGNYFYLAGVVGVSPAEAEARWDDMCAQLAGVYTFERATHRDDIEDILLAQMGIKLG